MSEQPMTPLSELTPREHRWLTALLILGTVAVAFVVVYFVTGLLAYFSDVIMIFFLAWLLAFILSPLASALVHLIPRLPRALAVILVYSLLIVVLIVAILLVAQQLYASINNLVSNWPTDQRLREILQPWQDRLNSVGGSQISLYRPGQPAAGQPQERRGRTGQAARRRRRRQPRRIRQPALRLLPVAVHGGRSGSHRQLPVPNRPAGVQRRSPAARAQRLPDRSVASCVARRSLACSTG